MGTETVNHPHYYNIGSIEIIDAIEDWKLNFSRGCIIKYVARAGYKDKNKEIEDLEKAKWYLEREIERLKKEDRKKPVEKYENQETVTKAFLKDEDNYMTQELIDSDLPNRAVCIQATPYGAVINQGCTLKVHKD